jgi:uncharacterized protein YdhG (YjbR/CyaY superfamily)
MLKPKPIKRGGLRKGTATATSVDEYLAGVPEPARTTLNKIRATIRSVLPAEAKEVISYGIPTFKGNGLMVSYAAFKNHCSLFVLSGSLLEQFKDELKGYETSKGTIRFPVDKPMPAALVKKLVRARIAHNESRKKR